MHADVCPQCGAPLTVSQARNEFIRLYCESCGGYERIETAYAKPWMDDAAYGSGDKDKLP